jgi:hypothetical protein
MPLVQPNATPLAALKASALGLAVLVLSIVVSFFAHTGGVRVNTEAWPPSARAILLEQPGQPISAEQWRRIDKELAAHGGNAKLTHLLAGEVRQTWFVFLGLAFGALLFIRRLSSLRPALAGLLVAAPSCLAVLWAFAHTHAYFR